MLIWVIFCHSPLNFPQIAKTDFRENLNWQKCVFGHFLTSDVIHIFLQCLILKSTYRTNETFFSRTHRFGCELQTSDAGWSSKVQKDNNSAAHVRNGMVYLTVPLDRRFRAQRPGGFRWFNYVQLAGDSSFRRRDREGRCTYHNTNGPGSVLLLYDIHRYYFKKANQRAALIHRSLLFRYINNLIMAFKLYVRPLLEYASPIWNPSQINLIHTIEAVQ